jgi:hypothetical protein
MTYNLIVIGTGCADLGLWGEANADRGDRRRREDSILSHEHPPPHFHAVFAEHRAQIDLASLKVIEGRLPRAKLRLVVSWAETRREALERAWEAVVEAGEDRVTDLLRITSAEPVLHGVLKITWSDGYEGIVDLRGTIAQGEIFEWLRNPEHFRQVRVESYGHSIYWGEEGDEKVDFGCDRLREMAEEQAALLARVS